MSFAPIFSIVCEEPNGSIKRNVFPMRFTPDVLMLLWEKCRDLKTVFGQDVRGDFNKFCSLFLSMTDDGRAATSNGLIWLVDGPGGEIVGMYYITDIYHPNDAMVHYIFFDQRHKGRAELTKKMIEYVFTEFEFNRLSAQIPVYASEFVHFFIKKLGFRKEGTKRKTHEYNGKLHDSEIYGLLNPKLEGK